MRKILFKNLTSLKKRRKVISVSERSEDKECNTHVQKSFVYIVSPEIRIDGSISQPDIYIKKYFNTRTKEEKFYFKVKGYFYITKDLSFLKVSFCHSLRINILWKTKVCSSNSATMS